MKPYDTGRRGASPGRQSVFCVYSKRRTRTPKNRKPRSRYTTGVTTEVGAGGVRNTSKAFRGEYVLHYIEPSDARRDTHTFFTHRRSATTRATTQIGHDTDELCC